MWSLIMIIEFSKVVILQIFNLRIYIWSLFKAKKGYFSEKQQKIYGVPMKPSELLNLL